MADYSHLKIINKSHGEFNFLSDTKLTGDFNTIDTAINCYIVGNTNLIISATDCEIKGLNNSVRYSVRCKISPQIGEKIKKPKIKIIYYWIYILAVIGIGYYILSY